MSQVEKHDTESASSFLGGKTASNISGAGLGLGFLFDRSNDVVDSMYNPNLPCRQESTPGVPHTTSSKSIAVTSPSFSSNEPKMYLLDHPSSTSHPGNEPKALTRHGTLLSANAALGRNAVELTSIMGDSTSRLKPGATILPFPGQPHQEERTLLEQSKTRARVKVDIILDSNIYVQGGYLGGHVKIKILECTRSEVPVMISGAKIRVIGFESISNHLDKYPFYQCSSPLETVTVTSGEFHDSRQDSEGFAQAIEGEHTVPFSMYLPMSAKYGVPKGSIQYQAGVAVRYIAMVYVPENLSKPVDLIIFRSIRVKDPISNGRSIAHFYRNCQIWPRLDPSIILAPAGQPLEEKTTVNPDPRLSGPHKINLTASVYRLHWVAGQQCFVRISVANDSKKTVKSINLALNRTTIVFKPGHSVNVFTGAHEQDYDTFSTSTTQKLVAESVLEMGRRSAPRHASTKGWWTGVAPGEHLEFSHSIMLPPDALSVIRSRLLQVDYSIKVTLSARGALRTTELQVSLPIQIINFISIDPPPSFSLPVLLPPNLLQNTDPSNAPTPATFHERLIHTGDIQPKERFYGNEMYTPLQDSDFALEHEFDGIDYDIDGDSADNVNAHHDMGLDPLEDLECFAVYENDADEIVPHILQDDPQFENAPRFADLYYASVQEDLELLSDSHPEESINGSLTCSSQYQANLVRQVREYAMLHSGSYPNSTPSTYWESGFPKGSSSFASRVQAKLIAAAEAGSLSGYGHISSDSMFSSSASSSSAVTDSILCRESLISLPPGNPLYLRQPQSQVSYTTSSEPLVHDDSEPTVLAALPSSESDTGSLPYVRNSTFTSGGNVQSRLLPEPPVVMNIESADYRIDKTALTGGTTHDLALDTYQMQPGTDMTPTKSSQHQERAPKLKGEPKIDNNGFHHPLEVRTGVLSQPSLLTARESQAGAIPNGSTKSVKARIRELEERQRLLRLSGGSGVRSFA